MTRRMEDALVASAIGLLLFAALWNAPVAALLSILVLAWTLSRESSRGRAKPKG